MFREDEAPSFFALKHSIYVGCAAFQLHDCCRCLEQYGHPHWIPAITSTNIIAILRENWPSDSAVRQKTWKSKAFGLKAIYPGVLCSLRLSCAGGPAHVGAISLRRIQWGIAALCEDLSSWVLGCLCSFFFQRKLTFSNREAYFCFLSSRMFSF